MQGPNVSPFSSKSISLFSLTEHVRLSWWFPIWYALLSWTFDIRRSFAESSTNDIWNLSLYLSLSYIEQSLLI